LGHQGKLLTASVLIALLTPLRSLVFGVGFFCIWCWWRRLRYVLYLAAAFTLFALGTIGQTLGVPHDLAWNFMVSATVYSAAVIALLDACQKRLGLKPRYPVRLSITGLVLLGVAYFCFVQPSLTVRMYVMNFGLGILTLLDAAYLRSAAKNTMDRVVFWVMLSLAIQSFPRTVLTFGTAGLSADMMAFAQSSYWKWMNWTYAFLVVAVAVTMIAAVVFDVIDELHGRATVDPLTGLLNRRGFEEALLKQVARAKGKSFSIAVCDIDNFKLINDSYGHAEGDAVLAKVAALVSENLRFSDKAARFGGEEFVLLLSDIHREDALELIERLRRVIEGTRFGSGGLRRRRITASFGIAEYRAGEELEDAIRRADSMLYAAKRNGRNQALMDWLPVELQVEMLAETVGQRVN
jgi:diguanylate cyclase (GGDEF)-like protein